MKKNVSVLGSTGSIGFTVLKIFKDKRLFKIHMLAADKNFKLICKQIRIFKPSVFIIKNPNILKKVKNKFKGHKVKIINFNEINKVIKKKMDITVAAIPGIAGLNPTIDMIKKSKKVLLANKESIICGWNIINDIAKKSKTNLVPIDSEHFSIMKILENQKTNEIKKIYLTASGGPFLNYEKSKFKKIKPKDAIKHPKWKMGKKISVDSATLMNKILEVSEAHKIFSIETKKIEIIIHPESLVHAIVEFKNGLFKFIYHETTMLVPIANAIFDKNFDINRIFKTKMNSKKSLDFQNLNFFKVDNKKFPMINLKEKINLYPSSPIIINAVNEILVDQFLKQNIQYNSIYKHLLMVLNDRNYKKYAVKKPKTISQIFKIDHWSRNLTYKKLNKNV